MTRIEAGVLIFYFNPEAIIKNEQEVCSVIHRSKTSFAGSLICFQSFHFFLYFFHGLGTFRSILLEQILLAALPHDDRVSMAVFRRDDYLDGIRINTICYNFSLWIHRANGFSSAGVLLEAPVSVAALERRRETTRTENVRN